VGSGHCSERDLVYEIAQAVKDQGKRFIAYLPCEVAGQSNDMIRAFRWNTKEGTNQVDFQLLYTEFIAEYANRYGSHLDGWWFDGAYTWSIFHNSYLNAFLYLSAARAGNPQTAVAFNDGSFCVGSSAPVVKDQDYLAGETEVLINGQVRYGREMDAPLLTPMDHSPQPPQNCLWHALVPIDCMWAHGYSFYDWQNAPYEIPQVREGEMEPPIYPTGILNKLVKDFKQVGGGVTFNVGIFQEGELGEATVAQLAELSRMIS
jgi:hypothetical protein